MIGSLLPDSEETHAKRVYVLVAVTLLVPVFLYSFYAAFAVPTFGMWSLVIFGLLAATTGATAVILVVRVWEQFVRKQAEELLGKAPVAKEESCDIPEKETEEKQTSFLEEELTARIHQLESDLSSWKQKAEGQEGRLETLEEENSRLQSENGELDHKVRASVEDTSHKEGLLQDYQQTIAEQRAIIDKKQQYVAKLEAKIQDLQYEVKTLLQLGELGVQSSEIEPPTTPVHPAIDAFQRAPAGNGDLDQMVEDLPSSSDRTVYTHYDAAVQLQKSLDVAKKLTGASHLSDGESSRFRDLSMDSYAIDLRRLFDSLRSDTQATILLYSQKEGKLLFVNNQVQGLAGWTPEKFVKDFPQLIQSSFAEWKHAIGQLSEQSEVQVRLLTKGRDGGDLPLHCYLGVIPEGAFSGHVIGVLYPAETSSPTKAL